MGNEINDRDLDEICGPNSELDIANSLGEEQSALLEDNSMIEAYLTPEERDERLTLIETYDFDLSPEDAELLIMDLLQFTRKFLDYEATATEILEDPDLLEDDYYPRCRIVQATSMLIYEQLASPKQDSEIPLPADSPDLDDITAIYRRECNCLTPNKLV